MLLYSVDKLFCYACYCNFKHTHLITTISTTSEAQELMEANNYGIAIFDTLYIGQCDNLIRYLSNAGTYIVVVMATQEQERYYTTCQHMLGVNQVFRKPIAPESYKTILSMITT